MHWRLVTASTRRRRIAGAWLASELRQSFAVRSTFLHVAESLAISESSTRATVGAPSAMARGSPASGYKSGVRRSGGASLSRVMIG